MPIKDQSIYPPYWKVFSKYIRFERADGKCEVCLAVNYADHPETGSKVVLTVAHLDADGDACRCQDETGFLCAKPSHCKAMCQRCHNRYDRPKRNLNAQRTLTDRKDAERRLLI